jgi:hypothetical protein
VGTAAYLLACLEASFVYHYVMDFGAYPCYDFVLKIEMVASALGHIYNLEHIQSSRME